MLIIISTHVFICYLHREGTYCENEVHFYNEIRIDFCKRDGFYIVVVNNLDLYLLHNISICEIYKGWSAFLFFPEDESFRQPEQCPDLHKCSLLCPNGLQFTKDGCYMCKCKPGDYYYRWLLILHVLYIFVLYLNSILCEVLHGMSRTYYIVSVLFA